MTKKKKPVPPKKPFQPSAILCPGWAESAPYPRMKRDTVYVSDVDIDVIKRLVTFRAWWWCGSVGLQMMPGVVKKNVWASVVLSLEGWGMLRSYFPKVTIVELHPHSNVKPTSDKTFVQAMRGIKESMGE